MRDMPLIVACNLYLETVLNSNTNVELHVLLFSVLAYADCLLASHSVVQVDLIVLQHA